MSKLLRGAAIRRWLFWGVWASSAWQACAAQAVDPSCQLKYPIVLSHHWSARPICPNAAVVGPKSCVNLENYERFCAVKGVDASGQRTCAKWQVPDADADLPPRDVNKVDATLKRSMLGYHRYFSRAIVDKLTQTCGNKVYLADKPVYASYEARARSLRHTVLQALAETKAAKVILIGVSQGAQDARFMTAALPVSDTDAGQGPMKRKVAAVVSLVGEDQGAESAAVQMKVIYLNNRGAWSDHTKTAGLWTDDAAKSVFWTRTVDGHSHYVLSEDCKGADCDLKTPQQRYAWGLRSLVTLSARYMRPSWLDTVINDLIGWDDIKAFTGMKDDRWSDLVPPSKEANNGVKYFSYAMSIRRFSPNLDRPELFYGIALMAGANDGYVSVSSQQLSNPAPNFEHIKTLNGASAGSGYHHMFATGRNDALYGPAEGQREAAPYNGDSASFYQQVARDLKTRGM